MSAQNTTSTTSSRAQIEGLLGDVRAEISETIARLSELQAEADGYTRDLESMPAVPH